MDNNKLIKCRKCSGNHLTIKCGKEKKSDIIINKSDINTNDFKLSTNIHNFKSETREYNGKRYKVKILNLPNNIEYNEISEFTKDWGHVLKINTKNFDNNSIAVIEFKYEIEADYFINALDNTPFDHYIIRVIKIEE
jgi:hypothetical protein